MFIVVLFFAEFFQCTSKIRTFKNTYFQKLRTFQITCFFSKISVFQKYVLFKLRVFFKNIGFSKVRTFQITCFFKKRKIKITTF